MTTKLEAAIRAELQRQCEEVYFWDEADKALFDEGPRKWSTFVNANSKPIKLADRFDLKAIAKILQDA